MERNEILNKIFYDAFVKKEITYIKSEDKEIEIASIVNCINCLTIDKKIPTLYITTLLNNSTIQESFNKRDIKISVDLRVVERDVADLGYHKNLCDLIEKKYKERPFELILIDNISEIDKKYKCPDNLPVFSTKAIAETQEDFDEMNEIVNMGLSAKNIIYVDTISIAKQLKSLANKLNIGIIYTSNC